MLLKDMVVFTEYLVLLTAFLSFHAQADWTLQSSRLILEISKNPYTYKLTDKITGQNLLNHRTTGTNYGKVKSAKVEEENENSLSLSGFLDNALINPDRLQIHFRFVTPEILEVTLQSPGSEFIKEEFNDQGEHVYGLWERAYRHRLDNRGVEEDLAGTGMRKWLDGMRYSSVRAPFYMTSRGYGIYVKSLERGHYKIARNGFTSFEFPGGTLTYDVIAGNYAEVLKQYNSMAGPSMNPPQWALDPIWWRDDIHQTRLKNSQQVLLNDADELATHGIPASAFWLDRPYAYARESFGWGGLIKGHMAFDETFPDPAQMISDLKSRGIRLLLWIANRTDNDLGREGGPAGYLLESQRAADMANPQARRWFQDKLDDFARLGIQGYKIDRGDENEIPLSLENFNAVAFPMAAAQELQKFTGGDQFVFARNLYDTGRKYSAVWNGDSYGWKGLRESVRQAIRCGLMNFPVWTSDTGGYGRTTPELFSRWIAFNAYAPVMEVMIGPKRTPWYDFSPEVLKIVTQYAREKHDLIPYVQSMIRQAVDNGTPVMRALVLHYPDDPHAVDEDSEYLFGSELLVAPISKEGTRSRSVYFPKGRWIDYENKAETYIGPQTQEVKAPLEKIPVFAREGAIIPRGQPLKIQIFPQRDGRRSVHGITTSTDSRGTEFNLTFQNLGQWGTLEIHCRKPAWVLSNGEKLKAGRDYTYDEETKTLLLPFEGAVNLKIGSKTSLSLF